MIIWDLKCKNEYMVVYEQRQSNECYNTAYFDLESQSLHVVYTEFQRNNEPRFVPMTDNTYYSSKYGYWVTRPAYLGLEDIRILSNLSEIYLKRGGKNDD